MKKYAVGVTVYIIEGNRDIRAGKIIHVSEDLYTIRFEYESAIRVHGSRLFASMEEAAEQLPVHLRSGFMEKRKDPGTGGSDKKWNSVPVVVRIDRRMKSIWKMINCSFLKTKQYERRGMKKRRNGTFRLLT